MTRLRWLYVLFAALPLLGCPPSTPKPPTLPPTATPPTPPAGGQVQQQQQSPTSKPASRPSGHHDAPKAPTGPKLVFGVNPKRTVSPRVDVTLERVAILPMTQSNIEAEPVDLGGLFQPKADTYYAAVVLRVTVNGKPWSEIDDGTGVERIGPFALELPTEIVQLNGTALSHPEQPDLAYMYRPIAPPISTASSFAFRVILNMEEGHTLLARFNDLEVEVQSPAPKDEAPKDEDDEDAEDAEDGK